MSKKKPDPFGRLEYIAYCRNYTPPVNGEYHDLIKFARNYLCLVKNVLYYDPVWDHYGDEELLVEYYSVRMSKDETFKDEIEAKIKGKGNTTADLEDWADKEIAKYNEEREQRMAKAIEEAKVDFSPNSVKGDK